MFTGKVGIGFALTLYMLMITGIFFLLCWGEKNKRIKSLAVVSFIWTIGVGLITLIGWIVKIIQQSIKEGSYQSWQMLSIEDKVIVIIYALIAIFLVLYTGMILKRFFTFAPTKKELQMMDAMKAEEQEWDAYIDESLKDKKLKKKKKSK